MSCLFDSLSNFYSEFSSSDIRNIIVNYIETNPKLNDIPISQVIRWEKGMDLKQYVNYMSHSNTWGGAIEIKVFCDIFKTNVIVKSLVNNRNIEFISNKKTKVWNVVSWNGGHYTPIRQFTKNK